MRPSLTDWAFKMAEEYAERGTCVRRKAGALALDEHNRIVGIGMNGVPRGFPHCIDQDQCPGASDPPGQTDNCLAVHAEANMVLNSVAPDRIQRVFVTVSPCKNCALLLANLPSLKAVAYREEYADRRGILILRRRGVSTHYIPPGSGSSIIAQ